MFDLFEKKLSALIAVLVVVIALCIWVMATSVEAGLNEYAKCKAEGGATEFCLIGDGS